jgi:hemolysin III
MTKISSLKAPKPHAPIMHRISLGSRFIIKEPVSALSHFMGALGALIALCALFFLDTSYLSPLSLFSYGVYGLSMFAVFLASALYHGVPATIDRIKFLNRLDHAMIYLFIAGTYYPIFLLSTPLSVGGPIVATVTAMAAFGIFYEFFGKGKSRKVGAFLYVVMGWVSVFGIKSLLTTLSEQGVSFLIGGGVLYTIGAVCYALKRPNPFPRVFGFHEIFHFFVLAGSLCHFLLVWEVMHRVGR